MDLLRRLTYRPEVRGLAQALGLRQTLARWYYRWARQPDGVLRLCIGGISAQFHVRTPQELRMLEGPTIATGINSSEKETLELLMASLRPGDIVYDVGANVGLYTVFLGKIVGGTGQVLAFEPDSRNYRRLQENIGLNRLPNVHCFRKALADRTGTAELYIEKGDTCVSSLVRPLSTGNIEQQVVELVEGDGFRRAENLPVPHAIKIDVEGSEYAVIQGLRGTLAETLCRLVCCEIHPQLLPQGVKSERICDLLKSLGFTRVEVVLRGLVQHVLCRKR